MRSNYEHFRAFTICTFAFVVMPAAHGARPPDPVHAPAGSHDLTPIFENAGLKVRRQGARGTCSVFAVVGALEYAVARKTGVADPLSVEFLNWAAHKAVNRTSDGGFFSDLWKGFEAYGICPEYDCPYAATFDVDLHPSDEAIKAAAAERKLGLQIHWIKDWDVHSGLTSAQLDAIKQTISSGWPVCGGFRWPKQPRWDGSLLRMCGAGDVFDGHSVLLVGWHDDPAQPGGGSFRIRNSGGGSGPDGSMSYEYVSAYMNDACWIDSP
ncbi:MAG TPA: C1 family peptidase [Armatimonadota bacterium]|nr:C1 family peptidase [Armatimonadota bacterium]